MKNCNATKRWNDVEGDTEFSGDMNARMDEGRLPEGALEPEEAGEEARTWRELEQNSRCQLVEMCVK